MLDQTKREKTLKAIQDYFRQMGGEVKCLQWGSSQSIICSAPMPDLKDLKTECICKLSLEPEEGFCKLNLADNWCVSKQDGEVVGNRARVKIVKNKVAPPFREAEFDIVYGKGISKEGNILDIGVNLDIVEKSGSWFSYNGEKIAQGREKAINYLESNKEVAEKLENEGGYRYNPIVASWESDNGHLGNLFDSSFLPNVIGQQGFTIALAATSFGMSAAASKGITGASRAARLANISKLRKEIITAFNPPIGKHCRCGPNGRKTLACEIKYSII